MKDIIIEAGLKLRKYLTEELDGRVTQLNTKRLNAVATDLLPGERYAHIRLFMELCERHHLLTRYAESDLERDARVGDIVNILKEKALITGEPARCCAALVIVICEGTQDAQDYARSLFEVQTQPTIVTPTPVPQKSQPQTQTTPPTQPTQPQKPNTLADFDIVDGVLKAYRGSDAHVVVPSSVKEIAAKAFADCTFLKSVVVPNSVKVMGSAVFTGCSSLDSITLPFVGAEMKRDSDTGIKPFGFIFGTRKYYRSISVTQNYFGTYYIPESLKHVTVTGGYMLNSAFDGCRNIETITFTPEKNNDEVAYWMFRQCESLQSFDIPDGTKQIITAAFSGCHTLQTITIPEGVERIYPFAFDECRSLTTITLPSSIKTIEERAFYGCNKLKEIEIPAGTTSIGEKAFENCTELEKVTIPQSVVEIGKDAFASCPKITIYKEGGLKPLELLLGTKWNPDRRPVKKI